MYYMIYDDISKHQHQICSLQKQIRVNTGAVLHIPLTLSKISEYWPPQKKGTIKMLYGALDSTGIVPREGALNLWVNTPWQITLSKDIYKMIHNISKIGAMK